jgi:hypothetical protein
MNNPILDVDFLMSPFPFDRHVVYRTDTGVLRSQVLAALAGVSRPLAPLDERAPIQVITQRAYGLFADDFTFYRDLSPPRDPCRVRREASHKANLSADLRSERLRQDLARGDGVSNTRQAQKRYVDDIIAALNAECGAPAVILANKKHSIFSHQDWPSARDRCLTIQEAVPTGDTVDGIVAFLEKTSALLNGEGRRDNPQRHSYLRALFTDGINDRSIVDLRDAIHTFDRAVLLYSDSKTGAFNAPAPQDGPSSYFEPNLLSELRDFVFEPNRRSQTSLLRSVVSLRCDGATSRAIAEKLCRTTLRILNVKVAREGRRARSVVIKNDRALIWICSLLIGCERLIADEDGGDENHAAGTFTVNSDEMLRNFSIAAASKVGDPFYGRWAELGALFGRHAGPKDRTAFSQLMSEIPAILAAMDLDAREWIPKLAATIEAHGALPQRQAQSIVSQSPEISRDYQDRTLRRESLHAILGNDKTIVHLRQRFASEDHDSPILLHGPVGTGKHTIARAYARTFLCYNRKPGSDLPCGQCVPCGELANDHGFIDFDASADLTGERGREVSRRIGSGLYPHRRVVLIRNAGPREETLDALLSKLESFGSDTAIILCMPDINAVEPTITSRCKIYRVRPLSQQHAIALVTDFMESLGAQQLAVDAVGLIVAQSEGYPARLYAMAKRAANAQATSFEQMRSALDGDWAGWSMLLWYAIAGQGTPAEHIPRVPTKSPAVQAFSWAVKALSMLHPDNASSQGLTANFDQASEALRHSVMTNLGKLEERLELTENELWDRLASIWTSDAYEGTADLRAAIRATSRFLYPHSASVAPRYLPLD